MSAINDYGGNYWIRSEQEEKKPADIRELIEILPQMPQVQYDSIRQLRELRDIANKFGLYDAADLLRDRFDL